MKKIIAIIIFAALSLTACTQGTEAAASVNRDAALTAGAKKIRYEGKKAVEVKSNEILSDDEKKQVSILGTWAYVDGSVVREAATITFNDDLSGNNSMVGDFIYSTEGKDLVFIYIDNKVYTDPICFEYRIEDDKLVMIDDSKQETIYQKR